MIEANKIAYQIGTPELASQIGNLGSIKANQLNEQKKLQIHFRRNILI